MLRKIGRGLAGAGHHWLNTDYWYGAKSIFSEQGAERVQRIFEATTVPDPRGKSLYNLFTGRKGSPLLGAMTFAGGVGYGVLKGSLELEEMKATGRVTGPLLPPFLSYDAVPNLEMMGRSTPQSAEEMAAGGDLVFALRDAYNT